MSDLTQIQTFIEVAENSSFSEAGKRLAVPRSTVSARIQALERRLSVRLFNRNTRRVSLTNEGVEYLTQCRQAIALLMHAEQKFLATDSLSGALRLTVPLAMPKKSLSAMLAAFAQRHPKLTVDVIMADEALDLVKENIDVAIRGRDPGDLDLIARKLGDSDVHYYASPAFIDAQKHTSMDDQLAHHCIFEPGNIRSKNARLTTTNFELALALACDHQGIVALPASICAESVKRGVLQKLARDPKLTSLPLYVVYSSRINLAPRVRTLIDFILEYHAQHDIT